MKAFATTHGMTFSPVSLAGLFRLISTAWKITRERRALANLDDRMLADMGISSDSAAHEAARPFWDLPGNR